MPEVEGEHFSYTVAGKAEAARKKAALKKKKSAAKKKKAAAKKKKPAAKKNAYKTGGLGVSQKATSNPAYARWLERKASVRNHFPNTDAGNRKLLQAIGPAPSKTVPKKKYARGGVTTPPTKQATRRAKYKKQAKSLLKKQRTS